MSTTSTTTTTTTPHHHPRHRHHHHHHHHQVINEHPNRQQQKENLRAILLKTAESDFEIEPMPANGEEAWTRLQKGNAVWASGELSSFIKHLAHEVSPEVRQQLVNQQHPFATIVTCSDSRLSPELIFDEGIGMLFVIRVAGNVIDEPTLGTIEYGCEHLGTPLLVLMGHQSCGAIKATFDSVASGTFPEGPLGALVKLIIAPVKSVKDKFPADQHDAAIDAAVKANVEASYNFILEKSSVISTLQKEGKLLIKKAEYYLDSGLVKEL